MQIDQSEDAMNQPNGQTSDAVTPSQPRIAAAGGDEGRPPGQLALSVFTMLVAGVVGISLLFEADSGFMCSLITRPRGANVSTGGWIVLLASIAGIVAAIVVRNHAQLLAALLLGEAATLSIAIGFVARDSATTTLTQDCGFFESNVSTLTHHVEYAYVVLGLAIAVLISQAPRRAGRSRRHLGGAIAGLASVALLVALLPIHAGHASHAKVAPAIAAPGRRPT
jgi:hypothetical protein